MSVLRDVGIRSAAGAVVLVRTFPDTWACERCAGEGCGCCAGMGVHWPGESCSAVRASES